MLSHGRLHKFIAKRCHAIRQQVGQFCATRDGEALHQLRVETKKLRACLSLLQECTRVDHPGIKGLKELYKTAGEIRTAQINLKILQDLHLQNDSFSKAQQKIIDEVSQTFCRHAHHYRHKLHTVEEHLQTLACDIKPHKVRDFFDRRIQTLSLFFSAGALDAEGLHEARKEVKELQYIYALLPPTLAASLGVNQEYLNELQTRIGTWHDCEIMRSLLQSFNSVDASITEEVSKTAAQQLQEILVFTSDFTAQIHAPEAEVIKAHH